MDYQIYSFIPGFFMVLYGNVVKLSISFMFSSFYAKLFMLIYFPIYLIYSATSI